MKLDIRPDAGILKCRISGTTLLKCRLPSAVPFALPAPGQDPPSQPQAAGLQHDQERAVRQARGDRAGSYIYTNTNIYTNALSFRYKKILCVKVLYDQ